MRAPHAYLNQIIISINSNINFNILIVNSTHSLTSDCFRAKNSEPSENAYGTSSGKRNSMEKLS